MPLSDNKIEKKEPKLRPDTIIVTGIARLPDNMANNRFNNVVTLEAEVDPVNSKVVDFSCSFPSNLLNKILCNAVLNETVEKGIRQAIAQIEDRFFSMMQRAIIAALEDIYKNWHRYLKSVESIKK